MAVSLEELMVSFGADTASFERGARRVKDQLKEVAGEAEKTGNKLSFGDKIQGGFASLQNTFRSIGSNLANIRAGMEIVQDVGGFFFDLAKGAAEAGSKFHDLSLQTGVSVETFSGLQLQLQQSGADMDALARAAVFLQKNLGEAASGNKKLQHAFAALGIRDVRAALADTDGALRTVVKSLGQMESAGERNAAGSKVMGRGFKELSVFLADTKGDLDAVIAESERAGRVMSTEAARAADEFGDQLDALTDAASVATRSFGMEFVPEITRGMGNMTGALQSNANQWREWGSEVANVLRGLREVFNSEFGQGFRQSLGWLWEVNAQTNPMIQLYRQTRQIGAQSRAGDAGRDSEPSPWQAIPNAGGGAAGDFFAPGGGVKRAATEAESARKQFIKTLHDWAETFNIPRSALREIGSKDKVHKGWAHKAGMATDISPRFMTPGAIKGAERMGLNVIPELYTGKGSTGPHYHIQAMTKGMKAAQDVAKEANKEFEAQEQILANVARALSEGELELGAFTQTTVEYQIASEYQRLGIGQLTGAVAELGEALFAQRAEQIKSIATTKEQAEAFEKLKAAHDAAGKGFKSEDLLKPSAVTGYGAQEPNLKRFDSSNIQVDHWKDFAEQFKKIRDEARTFREEWQAGLLGMAQDGNHILGDFFMSIQNGWKDALANMGLAFIQSLQQMAAQAAATAIWSSILNMAGGALGGLLGVGGNLPAANVGGGVWAGIPFHGNYAAGGFIPPGKWGVAGERGPDPVFGGRTGATVMPNGAGAKIDIHVHGVQNPSQFLGRETQSQLKRKTQRALGFDAGY